MRTTRFIGRGMLLCGCLFLLLAACRPAAKTAVSPTPLPANATSIPAMTTTVPPATGVPPTPTGRLTGALPSDVSDEDTSVLTTPSAGAAAVVAYIKDGDIHLWDEASRQSETIFSAGDVIDLTMSDDGQVVTFLRRSVVRRSEQEWYEQSALWAVSRDGQDARELVSAEELRGLLNASETDSTNFAQMAWIPRSHQLLYSGWTYYVMAEGESHAIPAGLYLVDTDTGEKKELLPATDNLRFAPSPDGQRIALISLTGLSFVDVDGSNRSPEVLPYPRVGLEVAFPSGVWAQDASAFLIAGPIEAAANDRSDLSIWRVPVDGSPAQWLAGFNNSHSDSVTFSPDGRHAAFYQSAPVAVAEADDGGWFVTSLADDVGPLASTASAYLFWQNLHWSPAGVAYAIHEDTLVQLCPDAAQDAEVCDQVRELGNNIANIHWTDGTRFLWVTREPSDLYFGKLDGTSIRLAEGAERFAAVMMPCRNDAELVAEDGSLAPMQAAPGVFFRQTWRMRNAGTCGWDPSFRLAFLGGTQMNGPRSVPLEEFVPPGGEIELLMKFIAPGAAGSYQGQWQLVAPDGSAFGVAPTVDILVPFGVPNELASDQIVASVPTTGPSQVASGEGALWVTSEYYGTVSRIDLNTNQVVATVSVGNSPRSVAVGHGAIWVADSGEATVSRIDPATNGVSATIPLDLGAFAGVMGIASGRDAIWVTIGITGGDSGMALRIDPQTNQVVATIEVERWPAQVVATEDAVWLTHSVTPILSRIDPESNEVAATIDLECPTMALAADATSVWAACVNAPTLFRIDSLTNEVIARMAVDSQVEAITLSPNGVWVASNGDDTLILIDTDKNRAAGVYSIGQDPLGLTAVQDELWVVPGGENAVWRIRP